MKKLMIVIPMLIVLAVGGTALASTDILKLVDKTPTVQAQSDIVKSEVASPTQTTTPQAISKVGVSPLPILTIEETLTSILGDRIIDKNIANIGPDYSPNAKGINITFKYLQKDNKEVDREVTQLIRELAKTGVDIPIINIWVRSPIGGLKDEISITRFNNVNIQELALLDDVTMLSKAKSHWVDVDKVY